MKLSKCRLGQGTILAFLNVIKVGKMSAILKQIGKYFQKKVMGNFSPTIPPPPKLYCRPKRKVKIELVTQKLQLNLQLNSYTQFQKEFILISGICHYPAGIYLLKVNNRNSRTRCEICSKLTIKTPKQRQWCRSGVFVVNFEHISHLVLVFLLLALNM